MSDLNAPFDLEPEIFVFGAGGHAKVVLESLGRLGPSARVVLLDDDEGKWGTRVLTATVGGGRLDLLATNSPRVMPALGDNRARLEFMSWARGQGVDVISVIDPTAIVSPSAAIGLGVFVAPGATINASAALADGTILNTAASIDHDCIIGAGVHLGPGSRLCGGVSVGEGTLIGAGAVVIPGIAIGRHVLVGAGAVVVRDLPDNARVAGNPARPVGIDR